jgi:two-component system, LytTR family, response regulator LytT
VKIVIIEDEALLAQNLKESIQSIRPDYDIIAMLPSVEEAISFFSKEKSYDLIFSDISLGDGLSFEIFNTVTIHSPIIFCTAHESYAVKAFETNGIDFILKPYSQDRLEQSLRKTEDLAFHFNRQQEGIKNIWNSYTAQNASVAKPIMANFRNEIIPFQLDDIALVYIKYEQTFLMDFKGKSYTLSESLEELEKKVNENFFRANRQTLVHRKSVRSFSRHDSRKLLLSLVVDYTDEVVVGKVKAPAFIKWLKDDSIK